MPSSSILKVLALQGITAASSLKRRKGLLKCKQEMINLFFTFEWYMRIGDCLLHYFPFLFIAAFYSLSLLLNVILSYCLLHSFHLNELGMHSLTNYLLVFFQLVKELGAPVEYIVLPTFAYEHKIFVAPFSRKFPKAQVWVAPRQWSWPLNLPLEFFGIFRAKF